MLAPGFGGSASFYREIKTEKQQLIRMTKKSFFRARMYVQRQVRGLIPLIRGYFGGSSKYHFLIKSLLRVFQNHKKAKSGNF